MNRTKLQLAEEYEQHIKKSMNQWTSTDCMGFELYLETQGRNPDAWRNEINAQSVERNST